MSRNTNSIGYIPPTPFRDDSDVFVLPSDPPAEVEESFPDGGDSVLREDAGLHGVARSPELDSLTAIRSELQQRKAEILRGFRELMSLLPRGSQRGPQKGPAASVPASGPISPSGGESEKVKQADSESAPRHVSGEGSQHPSEQPRDPGNDRLAALKAQLAARLQLVQGSGPDPDRPDVDEEPRE